MAFIDLIPNLKACFTEDCTNLQVTDITGLYHVTLNPGGWQDVATVETGDVSTAVIKYKHSSETTYTEQDVIDEVNAADPLNDDEFFLLGNFTVTTGDGLYHIIYELTQTVGDITTTITDEANIYNLCGVRCCIDKLWLAYAESLEEDCNCSTSKEMKAIKAENLYEAILSAASSGNITLADSLLVKLQLICTKENCNCN